MIHPRVHELGCKESLSATIKEMLQKQISKCDEIIHIAETHSMSALGYATIGIRLFETHVIPALLFNSKSWIGLNNTHLTHLQNFQDKFLRKLMALPPTIPKAILYVGWEHGDNKVEDSSKETALHKKNHGEGGRCAVQARPQNWIPAKLERLGQ